ncbi:helix-hairpin-helix domain-containing protein, partial [uncultured Sulfitobacter sp.]|uniref:helix-hairpin-helix domain-containing protein n=1 Tax=uncultured Sulfitobacter sp. TaxID=191468 RepID=UPI002597F975
MVKTAFGQHRSFVQRHIGVARHHIGREPRAALAQRLHDAVVSCVNLVGVVLNTASARLLTFVSGLGPNLAKGIVQYREANGAF